MLNPVLNEMREKISLAPLVGRLVALIRLLALPACQSKPVVCGLWFEFPHSTPVETGKCLRYGLLRVRSSGRDYPVSGYFGQWNQNEGSFSHARVRN